MVDTDLQFSIVRDKCPNHNPTQLFLQQMSGCNRYFNASYLIIYFMLPFQTRFVFCNFYLLIYLVCKRVWLALSRAFSFFLVLLIFKSFYKRRGNQCKFTVSSLCMNIMCENHFQFIISCKKGIFLPLTFHSFPIPKKTNFHSNFQSISLIQTKW